VDVGVGIFWEVTALDEEFIKNLAGFSFCQASKEWNAVSRAYELDRSVLDEGNWVKDSVRNQTPLAGADMFPRRGGWINESAHHTSPLSITLIRLENRSEGEIT